MILTQHRRSLLNIFDAGDLQILEENALRTFLTHRCALCGYWAARTQQMSAHMFREHSDATGLVHEVLPNTTHARMTSPCEYCKTELKSKTDLVLLLVTDDIELFIRRLLNPVPWQEKRPEHSSGAVSTPQLRAYTSI